jgi:hypothetical protein
MKLFILQEKKQKNIFKLVLAELTGVAQIKKTKKMNLNSYKKTFYVPLVVFLFLLVVSFVFYINKEKTATGDYLTPAPERLNIIIDEVKRTLYDITESETGDGLFSEVTSLMNQADCQYAESLCREEEWTTGGVLNVKGCGEIDNEGVVGSLWASKTQEEDFYAKQEELKEKKEQLEFLQNIIKKEMKHGIAEDIKQMRIRGMNDEADAVEREVGLLLFLLDPNDTETREILDDEIINEGESILSDSGVDWSTESLVKILGEVVSISPEESKAVCAHFCDHKTYTLEFCFNTTKQESVDLVFNIALELEDLNITPIEIKEIILSLPEEVEVPEVKLELSVPIPDINIDFPSYSLEKYLEDGISIIDGFSFQTDPFSKKGFHSNEIGLSCPSYESHSVGYSDIEAEDINPTEIKWFFETYAYLSDGCNKITSTLYEPIDALCYDPKEVISTTTSKCASAWSCHPDAIDCSCGAVNCDICEDLYCKCPDTECSSCTTKDAQAVACTSLFLGAGEAIPSACIPTFGGIDGDLVWYGDILLVMKEKCLEVLEEEKEKSVEEQDDMPYECALVAAWEGDIDLYSDGYSETIGGGYTSLEEGKIGVLPDTFIGCDPPEIPSFPKIPLSDFNIEIPDIITPDINFCPIVKVKLPDIIIEDLEFPDIELCNLQECQELLELFPNFIEDATSLGRFSLPLPRIELDPIELSPVDVDIEGYGVINLPIPDIEITPLENVSLAFHMPQMPNLNSISLSEFIYEIPGIEMPTPKLTFSFGGININWMSVLIGSILNIIMADLPSGCVTLGVSIGCLNVEFEDYHISWGDFPKIPEIPGCVTAQEFCRNSKEKLGDLVTATNNMVNEMHDYINENLKISAGKMSEIQEQINEKIEEAEEVINDTLQSYDFTGVLEGGIVKIDSVDISIDDIEIDISLSDIGAIPETITIPWSTLGVQPKITLSDPIKIEMPTIPLSNIGVEKKLIIYIPFLQVTSLFDVGIGGSSCESKTQSQSVFQDFFDDNLPAQFSVQIEDIMEIIGD